MTELKVGAHVPPTDPLAEAEARKADIVQIFVSNPQSWKKPVEREDADELAASEIPIYVHAPYLINPVTSNNRVRIPSRKILQDTCDAEEVVQDIAGPGAESELWIPRDFKVFAVRGIAGAVRVLDRNAPSGKRSRITFDRLGNPIDDPMPDWPEASDKTVPEGFDGQAIPAVL